MTRLAYVCADPGVPVYGSKGASVHVQEVIRALRRRGAEVQLFTARTGGHPPPDLADVPVTALPAPPGGDLAARERGLFAANDALAAALERAGPFDAVYERYALWSCAGMETARRWGVPGLLEVNAPLAEEQRRHRGLVHVGRAHAVARRAFGAATALLPVSDEVGAYLRGFAGTGHKLYVTPNGVDPARFLPNAPDPARFTVGFVGTLKPWHGVEVLLAAFSRLGLPQARLELVGAGPEGARLEAEAARLGLGERVAFTGAVAPAHVPALLAAFDVAVAPYPAGEDFYFSPLKVYEYMAAGLPVVASRAGQLGALVRDGENGLLCPPGDVGAFAEALRRLAHDPRLRERLGRAARATVRREHTWEAVAAHILALAAPAGVR